MPELNSTSFPHSLVSDFSSSCATFLCRAVLQQLLRGSTVILKRGGGGQQELRFEVVTNKACCPLSSTAYSHLKDGKRDWVLYGPFTSTELTSRYQGPSFTGALVSNAKQAEGNTGSGLGRYNLSVTFLSLNHLSMKHYRHTQSFLSHEKNGE